MFTFNVGQYISSIVAVLNRLDRRVINKPVEINEFCEILSDKLYFVFDPTDFNLPELLFEVERKYDKQLESGNVGVSGSYTSLGEWLYSYEIEEEVVLHIHSADKIIYFTEEKWRRLKFQILQTLLHEIIHAKQSRMRRGEDASTERDGGYLEHPDEIEAYAVNAALEIAIAAKENQQMWWEILPLRQTLVSQSSESKMYIERCGTDRRTMNRLYKHIYKYCEVLDGTNSVRKIR